MAPASFAQSSTIDTYLVEAPAALVATPPSLDFVGRPAAPQRFVAELNP
jgi:hypothetical protein